MEQLTTENAPEDHWALFGVQKPTGSRGALLAKQSKIINNDQNITVDVVDHDEGVDTKKLASSCSQMLTNVIHATALSEVYLEVVVLDTDDYLLPPGSTPEDPSYVMEVERIRGKIDDKDWWMGAAMVQEFCEKFGVRATTRNPLPMGMLYAVGTEDEKVLKKWRKRISNAAIHQFGRHHYRPEVVAMLGECQNEEQWESAWKI